MRLSFLQSCAHFLFLHSSWAWTVAYRADRRLPLHPTKSEFTPRTPEEISSLLNLSYTSSKGLFRHRQASFNHKNSTFPVKTGNGAAMRVSNLRKLISNLLVVIFVLNVLAGSRIQLQLGNTAKWYMVCCPGVGNISWGELKHGGCCRCLCWRRRRGLRCSWSSRMATLTTGCW